MAAKMAALHVSHVAAVKAVAEAAAQKLAHDAQKQQHEKEAEALRKELERVRINAAEAARSRARVALREAEELKAVTEALQATQAALAAQQTCNGRVVVMVTTPTLSELVLLVNRALIPTVYDLGGEYLRHSGNHSLVIETSWITLRNGIIILGQPHAKTGPSLCVKGTGVKLNNLLIVGGHVGLSIKPGANVSLLECAVQDAYIGIWVGGTKLEPKSDNQGRTKASEMTAVDLTVSGCGEGSALTVGLGAEVELITGRFFNGGGHGVVVYGDAPSRLRASKLTCEFNKGLGMSVQAGADVDLNGCSFMCNTEGSLSVSGAGSHAWMTSCSLDVLPVSSDEGGFNENWGE